MRHNKGLTLIEIIIALALLGILVSFVVSSLAGSFQVTRENRKSLDATTTTQRILENVRGQWDSRAVYNTGCANVVLTPTNANFMTLSANQQELTPAAVPTATPPAALTTPCGTLSATTACVSPMKRVVVVAVDSADATRTLSRVTLDIVCPVNP